MFPDITQNLLENPIIVSLTKEITTMEVIIIKSKIYKLSKCMDYLGFANYKITNVSQHNPKLF
jgi:hypothetical protein